MANDIIDINVYETVETVAITVNPNLTTININQVTGGGGSFTNLSTTQTVSNFTINSDTGDDALVPLGNGTLAGASLNNYTTAEQTKLGKYPSTATNGKILQGNGTSYVEIDTPTGTTNLGYIPSPTNGTVTSSTGSGATIPLADGTNAGLLTPAEKTKLSGIATGAEVNVNADWNAVSGDAQILNKPAISGTNTGDQNLQSVTDLGASTTNSITANSFVKSGGTSSQILAADGSIITAGNNITITGGQISSVGGTGGGGSSVNYYLNGGTSQGTFGGTTYYEFSKTAVIGTGADFSRGTNGLIASFITDVADPSLLLIPAGNWNLEFFFSSSSAGGSPSFYVELYKYDGTTFTSIASSSATPEGITGGTAIDAYFTPLALPETVLTVNDRLAIRVFVNASSKTITLHTQNGHLCEVITTFTAGLTALNGLQAQVQNFATGTTGTDFAINSSGSTHTFNLPSASATARGVVTTGTQTFNGNKTFNDNIIVAGAIALSDEGGSANSLFATDGTYYDIDNKQNTITLTTTGSSGASTLVGSTLNIPQYSGGGTVTSVTGTAPVSVVTGTTTPVISMAAATTSVNGYLTSTNFTTFNNKQNTISLTTTGTSGAATLTGATLNIPQYGGATNLTYTASPTNGTVVSDTGTDATLPLADATNAGLLKPAKFTVLENTSGTNTGDQDLSNLIVKNAAITAATNTKITYDAKGLVTAGTSLIATDIPTITQAQVTNLTTDLAAKAPLASPTFTGTPSLPTGTTGTTQTPLNNSTRLATTAYVEAACAVVAGATGVQVSSQDTFGTNKIATVTAAQYAAFVTAGTVSSTTLYFITA